MIDILFRAPMPCELAEDASITGLIEIWPTNAGVLPGGGFDVDAWEESKTILVLHGGGRAVFKEAWREIRKLARRVGGCNIVSLTGFEPAPLPQ